jgi:hypothetical protein
MSDLNKIIENLGAKIWCTWAPVIPLKKIQKSYFYVSKDCEKNLDVATIYPTNV